MPKNDFDRLADTVQETIGKLAGKSVQSSLKKVESAVNKIQVKFFRYLVSSSGVFGGNKAPSFPGISLPQPAFKPLSPDYVKRKYANKSGKGKSSLSDRFFMYKGTLANYLLRTSPINKFGKPIITFTQVGSKGSTAQYQSYKTQGGFKLNFFDKTGGKINNFTPLKGRLGTINVDLFPLLKGPIPAKFEAGDYFPPTIAYRLDNYKGHQDRYFLSQYMQWWVRVKAKEAIKGAL